MRRLRAAAWAAGIALAYYAAARLGLRLAVVHESASAVWPATGIALAAALLMGPRVWPAVFVPAFLVNQTTAGSVATSLAIASGNTVEAVLAAWLVRRLAAGPRSFDSAQLVLRFAGLAMIGCAVSATAGVGSLAASGYAAWATAPAMWLTWWLGDLGGAVIVAPLILLWADARRWTRGLLRLGELALLLVVVAAFAMAVYGPMLPPWLRGAPLGFLCLPPLLWAAVRFGPRETATATALLCGVALAGTLVGLGPYGVFPPRVALVLLQGFMVVTSVMVLALAAAVAEQERGHGLVRDRAAQALAEAQAMAHIGSWTWDVAADTVTWSDELYRIFGLERGTSIAYDTFLSAIHPGDRERVDQVVRTAAATGEPFAYDHRILRPDGSERWLHARGSVEMGPQGPVRMVGTGQDITERRRAEEVSRAFLANAAHELRTPLTSVMGLTDLIAALGRAMSHPLLAEYCDMLRKQGLRARRLISGLLDVSRMEQGLLEIAIAPVRVEEIVRRAADAVPAAREQGLAVDVVAGLAVHADPLRLEEALVNLLQNAYRYGGARVGVSAAEQGEEVHIAVWDDGPGVAADLVPMLFTPFARGAEAREVEGAGLGLAIVRGLVQALEGRVWYEPRQPQGARFVVSLPRASSASVTAA